MDFDFGKFLVLLCATVGLITGTIGYIAGGGISPTVIESDHVLTPIIKLHVIDNQVDTVYVYTRD